MANVHFMIGMNEFGICCDYADICYIVTGIPKYVMRFIVKTIKGYERSPEKYLRFLEEVQRNIENKDYTYMPEYIKSTVPERYIDTFKRYWIPLLKEVSSHTEICEEYELVRKISKEVEERKARESPIYTHPRNLGKLGKMFLITLFMLTTVGLSLRYMEQKQNIS